MPYERSRQLEERLREAARRIEDSPLNAGQLAAALAVSRPTAHRVVAELKRRGYAIRSVRDEGGWSYEFFRKPDESGSVEHN